MSPTLVAIAAACVAAVSAHAQTENFDKARAGSLPEGWEAGVTGKGRPRWAVGVDSDALHGGRLE